MSNTNDKLAPHSNVLQNINSSGPTNEIHTRDPPRFNPSRKKKNKRTLPKAYPQLIVDVEDVPTPSTNGLEPNNWLIDDDNTNIERDYNYSELLKRLYDKMDGPVQHKINKRVIEPPLIGRLGSTRVVWTNFNNNCESICRPREHVYEFVLSELGTTGSITADNKMVMKGRFQPKQIENLLKKYINEYVTCNTCRSPDTLIEKSDRILFKVCSSCKSSSSVSAIRSGYRAQLKKVK